MKAYGVVMYNSIILDLGTSWRWVVSFTSRPLYPRYHWIGLWTGPKAGLDDVEKPNSSPYQDSKSDPSVVQPVACTDWAIPGMEISRYVYIPPVLMVWRLTSGQTESFGTEHNNTHCRWIKRMIIIITMISASELPAVTLDEWTDHSTKHTQQRDSLIPKSVLMY
jgi:hypothetical protein